MKKPCCTAIVEMNEFKRNFRYNNSVILTLNIKYPLINIPHNKSAEDNINNMINMQIREYYNYVSRKLYNNAIEYYRDSQTNNFPFHVNEAIMEYNITYNDNCFLSLYKDKYEFTGGAHGSTIRSSDTWETCQGTYIPMYCYFYSGTNYMNLLINEITKQAEQNLNQNPGIYFEDYKNLIIQNFNPDSYFLTPYGMNIYYQQYDIAPYSTGIVEFTIPYEIIGWYPSC
ncbi:DUF3298 and DUF4163 domain-containing protein [Sedimentibacter saalensis]|uniref:Uncharacterized protein DUF3298 n=1 Tax=Sedimentibacter saalensis TaxID=130788 RepID=A0A562JC60_9FIRM|nr:DUF3298 and DUF4163 domain-containing protein [Sedimentibacter saalensis]TWH80375.1 uncharacterized protein DUF3298 [Sedimentibacter saalensis]